ncbi:hypothetical protein [Qipengyuania nanhaisediminis]|uniref:hypothetical protein n=1 Tax=Qipengyuania nanhaisediminis TaxID=604088 RepID=UPI0038B31624
MPAIATLPHRHKLAEDYPQDFERIDRDRHWAGVAVVPAKSVQGLADCPPDGEPVSLLLRLALQAQVPCRGLGELASTEGDGVLFASSSQDCSRHETARIAALAERPAMFAPGRALAALFVRAFGARTLAFGPKASATAAVLLLVAGGGFAWAGHAVTGLMIAALGALAGEIARGWSALKAGLLGQPPWRHWQRFLAVIFDVGTAIICWMIMGLHGIPEINSIAALALLPVLAIGLIRLCSRMAGQGLAEFWDDRALHLLVFALATAAGGIAVGIGLVAIAALAYLAWQNRLS